ncbi:hypothetical protein [Nocardia brasiliensis]|uniref:hypothetical protein n=1 Tax=Nocardia brasiliensis TaxID=37326 RepID=UPI0036714877
MAGATARILGDLRGFGKRRRRIKERIDDRIRVRQPLLQALVEYVENRYEHARDLLEAAAAPGSTRFGFDGIDYELVAGRRWRALRKSGRGTIRLRVSPAAAIIEATQDEDYCFWRWAAVR